MCLVPLTSSIVDVGLDARHTTGYCGEKLTPRPFHHRAFKRLEGGDEVLLVTRSDQHASPFDACHLFLLARG